MSRSYGNVLMVVESQKLGERTSVERRSLILGTTITNFNSVLGIHEAPVSNLALVA
jgi:hypothetical protein